MRSSSQNFNIQFVLTIIISVLIQLFMLFQNMIAASRFGISGEMDAFNIAYNITTFIFSFFSAAITTILIPNLVRKKFSSVNTFITVLIGIIILSSSVLIFCKDLVVKFVGGKELVYPELTSYLLIFLTVGYFFRALTGITNAIYQTNNKYVFPKLSQFLSLSIALALIVFVHNKTIYFFTIAIAVGFIVDFIFQILSMKKSFFKFKLSLDLKDKDFRIMLSGFLPIFISTSLFQISLLVDIFLANKLGQGNVSILSYSNQIVGMINALFITNLLAFMYPKMASLISKDKVLAQETLLKNLLVSIMLMIYLVLEYFLLGKEVVTVFFERGMFTNLVTNTVYNLSILYFLALPFTVVRDLFYRYFYGDNDTMTPLKNSILITVLKIVISLILSNYYGLYGLVLGTVIGNIISVLTIFLRFRKKYSILFNKILLLTDSLKLFLAGLIVALLIFALEKWIIEFDTLWNMIIIFFISTALYFSFCYVFRVKTFGSKFFNFL